MKATQPRRTRSNRYCGATPPWNFVGTIASLKRAIENRPRNETVVACHSCSEIYCENEPQRLLNEPVGTVGCAPLSKPALFDGLGSAATVALLSAGASGLASGACALGAVGRIAPAFPAFVVVAFALLVAAAVLFGTGAFGAVAAVCVDFVGCDFFFCAGVGSAAGAGSDAFQPTNRDMRSNTPSELDGAGSGLFDANRPPNRLPDEPLSPADATTAEPVLPVAPASGARGGTACEGIVPGVDTPGVRITPDASE